MSERKHTFGQQPRRIVMTQADLDAIIADARTADPGGLREDRRKALIDKYGIGVVTEFETAFDAARTADPGGLREAAYQYRIRPTAANGRALDAALALTPEATAPDPGPDDGAAGFTVSEPLTTLTVTTHHPEDYELVNHEDGTRWRGTKAGGWTSEGKR